MDARQHSRIDLPAPPATVHMVGIGGTGMSGLARILAARGYHVTGSDAVESPAVSDLRSEGFLVAVGHDAANIGSARLVVMTAAAPDSNPELVAARARGIPVVKRAALLGMLCDERVCIAVAGTHGKSTTTGMLALALTRAGADPSFAVGATVNDLGTNARPGRGRVFVAEADEYDYSFLWLHPDVAVVTNIEYDHPDLFPTLDAVDEAFGRFAAQVRPGGALVVAAGDPGCQRLISRLGDAAARVITFGASPGADWWVQRADDADVFHGPGGLRIPIRLRVPGAHNRLNAVAALAAADAAGVDPWRLVAGLEEFSGVGRRFEVRGVVGGITVVDDYAHHPTEVRATIAAARERFPGARLWTVFQPHTFSRTRELLGEFAAALSLADRVVLAAIYPARETDDLGVSADDIARRIAGPEVTVVGTPEEAGTAVEAEAQAGDVVLILGAGDIWKAGEVVVDAVGRRAG